MAKASRPAQAIFQETLGTLGTLQGDRRWRGGDRYFKMSHYTMAQKH